MRSDSNAQSLARSLSLVDATALVVGIIIGASIFVQPSLVSGGVAAPWMAYSVWIAAGALTLLGALIAAELASAYPHAGGVYVFLREALAPDVGFLWGWAMFWTMHTGIVAVIAMVCARYVAFFAPMGDGGVRLVAVGAIVLLTLVNYAGVRIGGGVQTVFTVLKVAAVVGIVALVFAFAPAHAISHVSTTTASRVAPTPVTASGVTLAVVAGLFAFGGWHMVTYAAEETRDAERAIPRALAIGVPLVTVCYVALNAAYFRVLSPAAIAASTRVAADAADAALGHGGGAIMSAIVVASTLGALNGVVLAGPRAYLAMARDGLFPRWAAAVHERFRTPHRALALQGLWAAVLVGTGSYRALFTRVVYTEWIFFALMAIGLLRLRRRADYRPAYRVWGYPFVPVVFIVCALAVVLEQIVVAPRQSLGGLALVAIGWPVYLLLVRPALHLAPADHAD